MINRSLDNRVCESFYAKDILLALQALKKISSMAELRYDLSNLKLSDIKSIKKASEKILELTSDNFISIMADVYELKSEAEQFLENL